MNRIKGRKPFRTPVVGSRAPPAGRKLFFLPTLSLLPAAFCRPSIAAASDGQLVEIGRFRFFLAPNSRKL